MMKSALILCLVLFALPAFAGIEEGLNAVRSGDYKTALMEFQALADQGDAVAQSNLGLMYSKGQGVPQDFEQAAEQGHHS